MLKEWKSFFRLVIRRSFISWLEGKPKTFVVVGEMMY